MNDFENKQKSVYVVGYIDKGVNLKYIFINTCCVATIEQTLGLDKLLIPCKNVILLNP